MNFSYLLLLFLTTSQCIEKRALQKSHEKPQWLKWSEAFLSNEKLDQQAYLVKLLKKITEEYLLDCTPVILYDVFTELHDNLILQKLLTGFPTAYIHGQISENYTVWLKTSVHPFRDTCLSYILFVRNVMKVKNVIGEKSYNRIVVVAKTSQWQVFDFLTREESQLFVNLLVIVKAEDIGARFGVSRITYYDLKYFQQV